MLKNMGHFLKEDVAIELQIIFTVFALLRTTKTFIAFIISYTTLKAYNQLFRPIFLSTTFYDLKVKFGHMGESPENFMSKYTQEV